MLLTSSQVSVAISSLIVVTFTLALFLSGYVIQQRTLRELREAIKPKPRPSPKIFLPDRFQKSTTELEDGTVVTLGDEDTRPGSGEGAGAANGRQRYGHDGGAKIVIEVRPSAPEEEGEGEEDEKAEDEESAGGERARKHAGYKEEEPQSAVEDAASRGGRGGGRGGGGEGGGGGGGGVVRDQQHPDPETKSQKPISRAERRRLIKEEIKRLSRGESPIYYQRRLW